VVAELSGTHVRWNRGAVSRADLLSGRQSVAASGG